MWVQQDRKNRCITLRLKPYHCLSGRITQGVQAMVCAVCRQEGARIRRVTRSYGKGEALFIIENVPVVSCLHCGTSYLTAQTLHEIDRIKRHRHELATPRPVAVAAFS